MILNVLIKHFSLSEYSTVHLTVRKMLIIRKRLLIIVFGDIWLLCSIGRDMWVFLNVLEVRTVIGTGFEHSCVKYVHITSEYTILHDERSFFLLSSTCFVFRHYHLTLALLIQHKSFF